MDTQLLEDDCAVLVRYISVHLRPGYMEKRLVPAAWVRTKLNEGLLYTHLSEDDCCCLTAAGEEYVSASDTSLYKEGISGGCTGEN